MSQPPIQPASSPFSHGEVQEMFITAQQEVFRYHTNTPDLCNLLDVEMREGADECNERITNPTHVLFEKLLNERFVIHAYNETLATRAVFPNDPIHMAPVDVFENDASQLAPLRYEAAAKFGSLQVSPVPLPLPTFEEPLLPAFRQFTQPSISAIPGVRQPFRFPPPVLPPIPLPTASAQNSVQGKTRSYDKLSDSPSAFLAFPNANFTLTEIMTFLPQSIKSWDIIDRVVWNSAMTVTLATMINKFRVQAKGPISNSAVLRMMQGQTKKRALTEPEYYGWTAGQHKDIPKPSGFNPASISVAGFRTPADPTLRTPAAAYAAARAPAPMILFRDLANGVKLMPAGDDALDLTRCIQHCLNNPGQEWCYPRDYEELLDLLPHDALSSDSLAGPAPVQPDHQDAACVRRHTSLKQTQSAQATYNRKYDYRTGKLLRNDVSQKDESEAEDTNVDDSRDNQIDYEPPRQQLGKRMVRNPDDDEDFTSFRTPSAKRTKLNLTLPPPLNESS